VPSISGLALQARTVPFRGIRLRDIVRRFALKYSMPEPIGEYQITRHAMAEMKRRGIEESIVRRVLAAPEQRRMVRRGRDVLQSKIAFGDKIYLVRVFVDVQRKPADVVTVYRTSNVWKYWRAEP